MGAKQTKTKTIKPTDLKTTPNTSKALKTDEFGTLVQTDDSGNVINTQKTYFQKKKDKKKQEKKERELALKNNKNKKKKKGKQGYGGTQTKPTTTKVPSKKELENIRTWNCSDIKNDLRNPTKVFKDCDANKNGKLEPDEVRAALKSLGSEMTDEKFTKMFNNLDKTHKGALSFSEFKKVLYQRIVYEAIDEDVSGSLDRDEIRESFKCILKLTVTDDEFEEQWHAMDKDEDGSVSFKEFKRYFKHPNEQKEKILAGRTGSKKKKKKKKKEVE